MTTVQTMVERQIRAAIEKVLDRPDLGAKIWVTIETLNIQDQSFIGWFRVQDVTDKMSSSPISGSFILKIYRKATVVEVVYCQCEHENIIGPPEGSLASLMEKSTPRLADLIAQQKVNLYKHC
jgi:hypothetical protein